VTKKVNKVFEIDNRLISVLNQENCRYRNLCLFQVLFSLMYPTVFFTRKKKRTEKECHNTWGSTSFLSGDLGEWKKISHCRRVTIISKTLLSLHRTLTMREKNNKHYYH
jgi:hypothetical protein